MTETNKENDLSVQDCEIIIEALESFTPKTQLKTGLLGIFLESVKSKQTPDEFEKELESKADRIKKDFDNKKEDVAILRAKVIKIRRGLMP